ncbi:DedA family protein [Knoellia sp. p5-6-4]|uniref:DedA family protein n=1 Tax=unclassified Knoellia TaxID=2618719 RepID=UPI0023DCA427|nr:DedA family protein [Knoellia sp. p5-6-4]MDF2144816.1 DedA family protein [Knoellia sp. p5-6-4]
MNAVIEHLLGAPAWVVYLVVGLVVFAEDALFVGFVLPGETLAILGGATASLGHTHVSAVVAVVVLAAVVGDSAGYEVGRIAGPRLLTLPLLRRHASRLQEAQEVVRRRGGPAIFLGRWTAFFRAVTPALAGMSGMPYRTFLPWNAVGGLAWGAAAVTAGYLAGVSYQRVERWLGAGAAGVVVAVAVVALVVWQVRQRRRGRGAGSPA